MENAIAILCAVNISFDRLEELINDVLGPGNEFASRLSARLELSNFVPTQHMFELNSYIIRPDAGGFTRTFDVLVRDFDEFLEPVRLRLADPDVFDDETYLPPTIDEWVWNLRRAAYFYLQGSQERWKKYADHLVDQADAVLELEAANDAPLPFIFTSLEALQHAVVLKTVRRAKDFLVALRQRR